MRNILAALMVWWVHRDGLQHAHWQVTFAFSDHRGRNFAQGSWRHAVARFRLTSGNGSTRWRADSLFRGSIDGAQSVTASIQKGAILWPRGPRTEGCVHDFGPSGVRVGECEAP